MQRHTKILQTKVNAKAVVTALICVVFLLFGTIVSAYAITPPIADASSVAVFGGGKPDSVNANALCEMLTQMHELNYFQTQRFLVCGKPTNSSSTRLYLCPNTVGSLDITDSTITITGNTGTYLYDITADGFRFYGAGGTTYTFNIEDVVCYWDSVDDVILYNQGYTPGVLNNSAFLATANAWDSFYNKVINYDTNLQNATNAGFAQGQLVGRVEGREEGYETGYDEGYDDGYDGGYEEGSNVGYQNGLTQGREEGYETGYDEGEQYGYEVGYREGQDYTYPIAYQEGYDDGYEQGASIGGSPSVSYELDVGSIISALPQAARNIIDGALGFEIFGINVAGTLTAILVVAIVGFVVKWLLSLKS